MREGKFELIAAGVDASYHGSNAFEERTVGGKTYAVAMPGHEYCVKVNVYRDEDGNFTPKRLRIGLYVDGNDVQYWKRIDLTKEHLLPSNVETPVSVKFWGFKKDITDIRSFQFVTPKTVSTVADTSSSNIESLGQIHAVIYEAVVVGGTFENKVGAHEVPTSQNISEVGKFWQQASLSTRGGRKLPKDFEQFDPLEKWINVDKVKPLHSMTLFYHTRSTLDCIESLGSSSDINQTSTIKKRRSSNLDGELLKRACHAEQIDLTQDDDDNEIQQSADSNSSHSAKSSSDCNPILENYEDTDKANYGEAEHADNAGSRKPFYQKVHRLILDALS